jgi:hypothetical protein
VPQTFVVPPPPQVLPPEQVPQFNVPPQPSGMLSQFLPCAAHVVGLQDGPAGPNIWISASCVIPSPLLAVILSRYCAYAVVFVKL